jgi:hypothetical protein
VDVARCKGLAARRAGERSAAGGERKQVAPCTSTSAMTNLLCFVHDYVVIMIARNPNDEGERERDLRESEREGGRAK